MSASEGKVHDTIEIANMTCIGCARTLENEFRKFKGIDYRVSFPEKSIKVSYSPADYSLEKFIEAIESHGYRVKGKTY